MFPIAMALFASHHGGGLLVALAFALLAGVAVATSGTTGSPTVRTYAASAAAMGKGLAVVRGADDNHVAIAGANVAVLGFVDEANININDAIGIIEQGEFYAPIGAAVTAGWYLKTNAAGQLVQAATAADNVVAMAITSGANVGDFIVALVVRFIHP